MKSIAKINDTSAIGIIDRYLASIKSEDWFKSDDIYKKHFTCSPYKKDLKGNI